MCPPEAPLIVICDDLGAPPWPLSLVELENRLRHETPGALVKVVPGACTAPRALSGALSGSRPRRVVVGCRSASKRRGELLNGLRRAVAFRGAIDIVDLGVVADGEMTPQEVIFEQSVALLQAASVRLMRSGLDFSVPERTSFALGEISRRSLFAGSSHVRQPVAVYLGEACDKTAACTACVLACPQGALSRSADAVAVDAGLCNGCGACVGVCRRGSFALPGAGLDGLGAASGLLVRTIRDTGVAAGVAIACEHSNEAPLVGESWLVLRVPSLELVTAGWLLQLVVAGVGARVVACAEGTCASRAERLEEFVATLSATLGFSTEVSDNEARSSGGLFEAGSGPFLELQEPEATTRSLTALGGVPASSPWRAGGPGCSLGEIEIDLDACSFCEVCARSCPTGALAVTVDDAGKSSLSFDPASCMACGACVSICPEAAVALDRRADGTSLAAGRRVLATRPSASCEICRAPLPAQLPARARAALVASHPGLSVLAPRLCADCRLRARSLSGARARALACTVLEDPAD